MKRSQSITLTVVAAMGMAARAQQSPVAPLTPVAPRTCEERRNAALAAGLPVNETCLHSSSIMVQGAARGGFGATGQNHSSQDHSSGG